MGKSSTQTWEEPCLSLHMELLVTCTCLPHDDIMSKHCLIGNRVWEQFFIHISSLKTHHLPLFLHISINTSVLWLCVWGVRDFVFFRIPFYNRVFSFQRSAGINSLYVQTGGLDMRTAMWAILDFGGPLRSKLYTKVSFVIYIYWFCLSVCLLFCENLGISYKPVNNK